jgi:hypothetical protein
VIFDGTLTKALSVVRPGEKAELRVGVMFMAKGGFGFRGVAEEMDGEEERVRFSDVCLVDV